MSEFATPALIGELVFLVLAVALVWVVFKEFMRIAVRIIVPAGVLLALAVWTGLLDETVAGNVLVAVGEGVVTGGPHGGRLDRDDRPLGVTPGTRRSAEVIRPAFQRRFRGSRMDRFSGAALSATAILLAGCAVMSGPQPEGSPSNRDEQAVMDPVGIYDVTMSSQSDVSEGTIEIRGRPGRYHGYLQLGSMSAVLESVEPGAGILHLRVKLPGGTLVLRLTGDGRSFSGNWVLDVQRGTVTATRRGKGESRSC